MCGHIGLVNGTVVGIRGRSFMEQGLFADQLRGIDATGMALVDKNNKVDVFKRALAASDFIQTNMGKRALKKVEDSFVVIGHNRAATIGKTEDETSHPFDFGRFVGAHNGTIAQYRNILPITKYPVDSMNLIASFNEAGNLHDILSKVHTGSYAVVVYDKEEEKLLLARNDDRPLHIVQNDYGIMWASEAAMLYWIASRNNLLNKDSKFIEVKTDQVISYDCNYLTFDKPKKFKTVAKPYCNQSSYFGSNKTGAATSNEVKSNVRNGSVHGVNYDFNLGRSEIAAALCIPVDLAPFWPAQFIPHSQTSSKGRLHGYVLDEADGTLFPATIYNMEESLYQESITEGKFLVVEITNGMFTKEGNIVHLVGINPTLDIAEEISIYDNTYDVLYQQKTAWQAGVSFSVMLGHPISNVEDVNIRKAYRIKSQNRTVSEHTLKQISLKPAHKSNENNKEDDSKKVVSLPASQSTKQKSIKDTSQPSTKEAGESTKSDGYDDSSQNDLPFRTASEVPGPDGLITPARFSILTRRGCCICSSDLCVEDAEYVKWLGYADSAPVCMDCWKDKDKMVKVGCDPAALIDPNEVSKAV